MRLRIKHKTSYRYEQAVTYNVNETRLRPRENNWQRVHRFLLKVLPAVRLRHYSDFYFNTVHFFDIPAPHQRLVLEVEVEVETQSKYDLNAFPYGFSHSELSICREVEECYDFLKDSKYVHQSPEVWREAVDIMADSTDVFQTSYAIMEHIYKTYEYVPGSTTVSTHGLEVFERKRGVCQDFAHVMLKMLRSLGIPARYASGYLYDPSHNYLRGAQASHAWVQVYIHGQGWFGLDPTNNQVVDERYVVLAVGRDYSDVAPVKGTYYGSPTHSMDVSVKIEEAGVRVG